MEWGCGRARGAIRDGGVGWAGQRAGRGGVGSAAARQRESGGGGVGGSGGSGEARAAAAGCGRRRRVRGSGGGGPRAAAGGFGRGPGVGMRASEGRGRRRRRPRGVIRDLRQGGVGAAANRAAAGMLLPCISGAAVVRKCGCRVAAVRTVWRGCGCRASAALWPGGETGLSSHCLYRGHELKSRPPPVRDSIYCSKWNAAPPAAVRTVRCWAGQLKRTGTCDTHLPLSPAGRARND